ncbi:MAG: OmpA family protein, partial [Oryzomonas sp.]
TTFTLKQDKTPVSGTVTSAASTATFTPARKFEKGKVYTATITTGAKDLAGNALERDYVWRFTAFSGPRVVKVLSTLDNSHFNFDSAEITENGKDLLKHDVAILKADSNMKIRISGYTSAAGSEEYNQKLSERRAAAAKEYLVKTGGIDGKRITTIGYGEKNPAQYEADPSDKNSAAAHANMRVLIEVIEE